MAGAAAVMPQSLVAGSGAAAGALLAALAAAVNPLIHTVDPHVASATVGASSKLAMVCGLVGWLLHTGQLPANTAQVMSRVSFTLLIPSMLFIRVAHTLAARPDPTVLATISVATLLQVAAGAALAQLLSPVVDRWLVKRLGDPHVADSSSASCSASGSSSGAAEDTTSSAGLRRLVTLACSFGSSFTLPVVFFTQMLPAGEAERALGFTALILLSWTPLMWSFGLGLVTPGSSSAGGGSYSNGVSRACALSTAAAGSSLERRGSWSGARPAVLAAGGGGGGVSQAPVGMAAAAEAAATLVAASRAAVAFGRRVLTPPFLAILAGIAAGLTPAGRILGGGSAAAAAVDAAALPAGAALVTYAAVAVLRSAVDVIGMLAGGALAAQTVVLASSLLQRPAEAQEPARMEQQPQQPQLRMQQHGSWLAGACRLLLPASRGEAQALTTVALTRFVLLPAAATGALWALGRAGLLPAAVAGDPILLLVLLVASVMPSAQNLIVLCSLSASTAGQAPLLASLLLKLYVLSILPVSVWVTCWASWLHVAVAA